MPKDRAGRSQIESQIRKLRARPGETLKAQLMKPKAKKTADNGSRSVRFVSEANEAEFDQEQPANEIQVNMTMAKPGTIVVLWRGSVWMEQDDAW